MQALQRLERLLSLANRAGTDAEGDAARLAAERLATLHGLKVYERDGLLVAAEAWKVQAREDLLAIADKKWPRPRREVSS